MRWYKGAPFKVEVEPLGGAPFLCEGAAVVLVAVCASMAPKVHPKAFKATLKAPNATPKPPNVWPKHPKVTPKTSKATHPAQKVPRIFPHALNSQLAASSH